MKPRDPEAVQQLFDSISQRYDFLNDFFSFGLHRVWKKTLLSWLKPSLGEEWIDLCCGTGDLSFALSRFIGPSGRVLGVDFSSSQIDQAQKRFGTTSSLSWLKADVLNNGLPSAYFDGAVMAYGLRNLSDPAFGLKEILRLLKSGGKAGVLDFNRPVDGSKRAVFQKLYLRTFVVPVASLMGFKDEYAYLEASLKNFPDGELQKKIALQIGFQEANYRLLAGGQMGVLLLKA